MTRKIIAATAAAALFATTALASGDVVLNDANAGHIRQMLTEQGYEVGKIKTEDGLYEAYTRKDGKKLEIFLNGDFEIVRTEED